MTFLHWQPFRELDEMQRDMNRLFDNLATTRRAGIDLGFVPAVELEETDDHYLLHLELPGLNPEEVNIEVSKDSVSISGERRTETRRDDRGVTRSEFHYGKFHRSIPLPGRINNQGVKADYQHGVLTVTLPKAEPEKQKVVKVQINT
ncbi:Hsp20/alpha crystallin family protein [Acaryochloris sp. IP29b_bin.148]|uniref:Hsp20/alpha crystallin family protein n=1 Tax=Acaryochloris sp. IP29b_bin.148 TaxID=2969218 RepID=UPI002623ACAC|nr:Hsp20/alpha crystallin family protein [Acaryochloris sp. IP29b_bin.148]